MSGSITPLGGRWLLVCRSHTRAPNPLHSLCPFVPPNPILASLCCWACCALYINPGDSVPPATFHITTLQLPFVWPPNAASPVGDGGPHAFLPLVLTFVLPLQAPVCRSPLPANFIHPHAEKPACTPPRSRAPARPAPAHQSASPQQASSPLPPAQPPSSLAQSSRAAPVPRRPPVLQCVAHAFPPLVT